ncbi:MAG: hypothetical protein K2Q07_09090, partial [Burkholderiaceae bacterium]|nr:hypothetical protein [Burkholderiaceae bacterium]
MKWPFSRKSTTPFSSQSLASLLASVFGLGGATKSGATVSVDTATVSVDSSTAASSSRSQCY